MFEGHGQILLFSAALEKSFSNFEKHIGARRKWNLEPVGNNEAAKKRSRYLSDKYISLLFYIFSFTVWEMAMTTSHQSSISF
jgi:hypothetical protein